jgi:hypothetical protein
VKGSDYHGRNHVYVCISRNAAQIALDGEVGGITAAACVKIGTPVGML